MTYYNMFIKLVNDLWSDGILTGICVVFYLFLKQHVIPVLKKKHANKRLTNALDMAERFAGIIIPEMAKMSALSNSDRKKEAVSFVSLQLLQHGIHLDHNVISCTVEKIFQYMKGMGHLDIDKPRKMPDPSQMTPQQLEALTLSDVKHGGDLNGTNR